MKKMHFYIKKICESPQTPFLGAFMGFMGPKHHFYVFQKPQNFIYTTSRHLLDLLYLLDLPQNQAYGSNRMSKNALPNPLPACSPLCLAHFDKQLMNTSCLYIYWRCYTAIQKSYLSEKNTTSTSPRPVRSTTMTCTYSGSTSRRDLRIDHFVMSPRGPVQKIGALGPF